MIWRLLFAQSTKLVMAVGCAVTLGCHSVNTELATLFGDVPSPASTQVNAPPAIAGPKYQVEFREKGKQPQLAQLALPDVLYVQQALEQSGALGRFRRMKIEIYRHLPDGGGHRLDIPFDRAKRRVPPAGDYAIHPNDRIVVTEDTSTVVDDMLESLGGPFSKSGGK